MSSSSSEMSSSEMSSSTAVVLEGCGCHPANSNHVVYSGLCPGPRIGVWRMESYSIRHSS